MSPNTFFYLVKTKNLKLWSDYGRERWCERILKIFCFLKSVSQAAQKCPKPLFSISLLKKVARYQTIDTSDLKNYFTFDRKVGF